MSTARARDVGAVEAGLRHDTISGVFHVSDDEPASNHDVLTWAADRLDVAPPPEMAYEDAGLSPMARSSVIN